MLHFNIILLGDVHIISEGKSDIPGQLGYTDLWTNEQLWVLTEQSFQPINRTRRVTQIW